MLSGGGVVDALCTFFGASVGFLARSWVLRLRFNVMISFLVAACVTTLIAGTDTVFKLGNAPEVALATAVLYLIPGVPLINSVIDLIEGYLSASLTRSLYAAFILLCIAAGMTFGITLLGIENF